MYICICNAVTDREVRQCAELGARSVQDLERSLGLGSNCGRCRAAAAELLRDSTADDPPPPAYALPHP